MELNRVSDAKLPQSVTPITLLPVDYVKLTGVSAQKKLVVARIK